MRIARLRFTPILFLRAAGFRSSLSSATEPNFIATQPSPDIQFQTDTMASQLSDFSFKRIRVASGDDIDRLYPVLAAYIQNPSLASTVTELVIDFPTWPSYPSRTSTQPAVGPDEVAAHAQMEAYGRALGLSDEATTSMLQSLSWKFNPQPSEDKSGRHSYKPKSDRGFASAALVLLLSLCPNITLIQAYELNRLPPPNPLGDFLLRNNYGQLPVTYLQRLERVHLQAWYPDDNREYDRLAFLDYFRLFGRLPALRTYSANAVVNYQATREYAPPGSSPSITNISITNADVSSGMLSQIIRVPRALENFTLSLGGLSFFEGGYAYVSPKTLGKCLLEQKTTLKSLDLDVAAMLGFGMKEEEEEGYDEDEYEEDDDIIGRDEYFRLDEQAGNGRPARSSELPNTRPYGTTIGSLHDFEALEHLAISVRLILGGDGNPPFRLVDALPRTLKSFTLYDYVAGKSSAADEHVQELKEKMEERFPFLKEVKGLDEPLIKNSKYNDNSGYDEKNPSELVVSRRMVNRGLNWE